MRGRVALDRIDYLGQTGRGGHVPKAPTSHGVGFAESVDGESEVIEILAERSDGGVFYIIINEFFVNFVGEDVDLFVQGNLGECGELIFRIDGACGVSGGVENDQFGHRAHVLAEKFGSQLVAIFGFCRNEDRFPASDANHFRVAEPIGSGNENFISGIHRGKDGVEAGVFGSAGHDDLGGFVGEIVIGF